MPDHVRGAARGPSEERECARDGSLRRYPSWPKRSRPRSRGRPSLDDPSQGLRTRVPEDPEPAVPVAQVRQRLFAPGEAVSLDAPEVVAVRVDEVPHLLDPAWSEPRDAEPGVVVGEEGDVLLRMSRHLVDRQRPEAAGERRIDPFRDGVVVDLLQAPGPQEMDGPPAVERGRRVDLLADGPDRGQVAPGRERARESAALDRRVLGCVVEQEVRGPVPDADRRGGPGDGTPLAPTGEAIREQAAAGPAVALADDHVVV